ncbi:hypothetical protein LTR91_019094 [Friedmanniomyces endolithicus]|uniref:Uncharacterized protein n=1 Tax=Friedmanniomyces endolithicus TaxID=329885 RepID=A0AAN6K2H0_9PEZI|nr:hypothetical protein LTR57_019750 [Friedmanniomyces endolithicus]KAK0953063.1 hypothetical protein LTS01_024556 [Friedmanniomyces endolithicus]KAK0963229.1 hypothetical protein LTR91_019094 [Friedmanniomyces endolithicus]KAK1026873.1 hypothetical protein LTS16_021978 [Friedmanniomyces endolithicus]
MCRQIHILNFMREVPTGDKLKTEQTVSLVDHTQSAEEPSNPETGAERADSDVNLLTPITNEPRLIKRLAHNSLTLQQNVRQQIAKQNYERYGTDMATRMTGRPTHRLRYHRVTIRPVLRNKGILRLRHRRAIWSAAAPKPTNSENADTLGLAEVKKGQDAVIDVLYENQHGSFLFRGPRYSASSLLPSVPRSWLNKDCRTSPVHIRNAQVPDPN